MITLTYDDLKTISDALATADGNEVEWDKCARVWEKIHTIYNLASDYDSDQLFTLKACE